jgi:predicted site-specific integrase-resolvase
MLYFTTPKETERLLDVSAATLRKMWRDGKIKGITLPGGHRRYDALSFIENGGAKLPQEKANADA